MVFYFGWLALHSGTANSTEKSPLVAILTTLSENWKGLLLLLIPLFYRTVRTFLEKVKKFAGMETEPEEKRTTPQNEGE